MRLEFSEFAEPDLGLIADYIAQDSAERAVHFILRIREKLALIAQNPHIYQLRPEIGDQARLAVVGRYLILYRITPDCVRIERIVFGGRDLPSLLI